MSRVAQIMEQRRDERAWKGLFTSWLKLDGRFCDIHWALNEE